MFFMIVQMKTWAIAEMEGGLVERLIPGQAYDLPLGIADAFIRDAKAYPVEGPTPENKSMGRVKAVKNGPKAGNRAKHRASNSRRG